MRQSGEEGQGEEVHCPRFQALLRTDVGRSLHRKKNTAPGDTMPAVHILPASLEDGLVGSDVLEHFRHRNCCQCLCLLVRQTMVNEVQGNSQIWKVNVKL